MTTGLEDLPLRYVMSAAPVSDTAPLVVILHGRGADMHDLAGLAPYLPRHCRYLFPNAPKPFEPMPGYSVGWSWFDGWPPVPGSLAPSREALLAFLDAAMGRFHADTLVLAGFSQGALMALDCGFRTTQPIAGIVALSGAIYEDELPPLRPLPLFLAHGTADETVPVIHARRTRLILEEHGVSPEYHELPMGHFVSDEEMRLVSRFLQRVTQPNGS